MLEFTYHSSLRQEDLVSSLYPLEQLFGLREISLMRVSQESLSSGFLTRSYSNWAVQPQRMARGLKFWI